MRLAIMQPYFFPYLGYFQLMSAVDHWIVFDTPQYIRHGWVNRNRVKTLGDEDWKYITLPLKKAPRETPINRMRIDTTKCWKAALRNNLDYYRVTRATCYDEAMEIIDRAIDIETDCLCDVLVHSLRCIARHLNVEPPRFDVYSQMNLAIPTIEHPGQWALEIAKATGASTYINPPGGKEIFNAGEFSTAGIELSFLTPHLPEYPQGRSEFVPGLSVIDALMWNGKANLAVVSRT